MAYIKRKVSFYRLVLEKQVDDISVSLDNRKIEESFQEIYNNKMCTLADGHKAIDVQIGSGDYVIEVVEYKNHFAFAKIGRQNSADTVALRDHDTLESEEVPMSDTQTLELYTYFLTDFTTGIISYIGVGGIPKISAIRGLYDINLYEKGITSRVVAIMTRDILRTVMCKETISLVEVAVAVPSDPVLRESMGLSMNNFDSLHNVKDSIVTYKLVAKRNQKLFQTSSKINDLFNSVIEKYGNYLKKFQVNAKDQGESSQPYDLLEYCFTKMVPLGMNNQVDLKVDDYRTALFQTYDANKGELLRYIR